MRQLETRETEFAILDNKILLLSTDTHYIEMAHPRELTLARLAMRFFGTGHSR
jgi:hypothetical protein